MVWNAVYRVPSETQDDVCDYPLARNAKWDRRTNGDDAIPIKTVQFDYFYSLAREVPNNRNTGSVPAVRGTGKLTLNRVSFTYGRSQKGQLSPYVFRYSDANPDYNLKGLRPLGELQGQPARWRDRQRELRRDLGSADHRRRPLRRAAPGGRRPQRLGLEPGAHRPALGGHHPGRLRVRRLRLRPGPPRHADGPGRRPGLGGHRLRPRRTRAGCSRAATTGSICASSCRSRWRRATTSPASIYFRFLVDVTGESDWEFVTGYADLAAGDWGRLSDGSA